MQDQSLEYKDIKPEGPKNRFQLTPQHIVYVQKDRTYDQIRRGWNHDECDDPPDLSMKDHGRVKAQILHIKKRIDQKYRKSDDIQHNQIIHQIRNRVSPNLPLQFV